MSNKDNAISRREFLQRIGITAVGSAIVSSNLKSFASDDEKDVNYPNFGNYEIKLKVNGHYVKLKIAPETMLIDLLRDTLNLKGTKKSCGMGECGTCTVLVDDKVVYSCHILALDVNGSEITTIEGMNNGEELHPIQKAFVEHDGMQCGFCTPGQIMAVEGILRKHKKPTVEQIKMGLSGNLCRCSAYPKILESAIAASKI